MRTIPEIYGKNSYSFRLISRGPRAALYEQIHKVAGPVAFEVVRIRSRGESTFERAGQKAVVEAGEFLPSNEEWGRFGWTYSGSRAEVRAREHLDRLNDFSATPS